MLSEPIRSLVLEEQSRQRNRFLESVDLDRYLAKLDAHAEILSDCTDGRCRGAVAFYCNDLSTRRAYITLVVVDPRDRGQGVGGALVRAALELARGRGFISCRLEVARDNDAAQSMYRALGFRFVEARAATDLLEVEL